MANSHTSSYTIGAAITAAKGVLLAVDRLAATGDFATGVVRAGYDGEHSHRASVQVVNRVADAM